MVRIEGLSWDEDCENHIGYHGIRLEEVEESVPSIQYARRSREHLQVLGRT
jgi:hypothetical protein